MHNGSVCEEKRKSEYRKGATYKYALLKAKSLENMGEACKRQANWYTEKNWRGKQDENT